MIIINLFLVLFLTVLGASSTLVSPCQSGRGVLPEDVEIVGCIEQPCVFYINAETNMTMRFQSPRYLENLRPSALALTGELNVTYPLDQSDACEGITNTPCPLAEGELVEYTYSLFILPVFSEISFVLEFALVDEDSDDEQIECFRVNINLKDLPDN